MNNLKKSICYCMISLSFLGGTTVSAQSLAAPVQNKLYPAANVKLTGYLADKLDGDLENRVLAQDVDRLVAPFKPENRKETRLWQSEFWGKWFTSAILAYRYKQDPRLKRVLAYADSALLSTETPDGYIGNYAADHRLEQWDIWGRKYCMLGLLNYYDLTGDAKSLNGASRIADNLMDDLKKRDGIIVNKGNYRGMAASSVLEPICLLYKATRKQKYLDFALEIVRQWETPVGPQLISKATENVGARFPKPRTWYSYEQGQKAYEMMSCYEGLLELYRLTGNQAYKKAVEDTWENIHETEINIIGSGASTEMWFGGKALQNLPINHYQETCVTVTWIKLTEQLFRLTGDPKYADAVETSYYNALLGSMSNHGATWAKYTPLNGQRLPGSEQCGMGLNCCEASGPRGLFLIPLQMVMGSEEGISVNYFASGTFMLKSPSGSPVTVTERTEYPRSGSIDMEINPEKEEMMEVAVRIPAWSKETLLEVNGKAIVAQPGQYARIKRAWKKGDRISLKLDMRARLVETGITLHSIAIVRGVIVLARDSRFEGASLQAVLTPMADPQGYIELEDVPAMAKEDPYMVFKAKFMPESYVDAEALKSPVTIHLCDYASAGNDSGHSFYQTWLPQLINPRENSMH